jgi:hypothetical protein
MGGMGGPSGECRSARWARPTIAPVRDGGPTTVSRRPPAGPRPLTLSATQYVDHNPTRPAFVYKGVRSFPAANKSGCKNFPAAVASLTSDDWATIRLREGFQDSIATVMHGMGRI